MTHVLIDRATLEQLVVALEDSIDCARHEYETYWGHGLPTRKAQIDRMKESLDQHEASITAGRAALANAEPAWWQTLVDHGKEAHELAKIMKDFADKNPESLMLKELDK